MLLGAIADDFTGASDLANTLARGGMQTTQFVGIPGTKAPADCEAGIVALRTRSIRPEEAVHQSLQALDWLLAQGCRQVLFKYCSTFDSTREGNIGPVAEALAERLAVDAVVVCPAFPRAGRRLFMGHLLVGDRLLSESGMERHPLTPMTDPDIRRWLSHQVHGTVGHVTLDAVRAGTSAIKDALAEEGRQEHRLVVVDAVADEDLLTIGEAVAEAPLVTGGSGIALGLPGNFRRNGLLRDDPGRTPAVKGRAVVLSGSCSAMSQRQVARYLQAHPGLLLDPADLVSGAMSVERAVNWAEAQTEAVPMIYSTTDPEAVSLAQATFGIAETANRIERFFGDVAARLVNRDFRRIVVGGGETSGAVVATLDVSALRIGPEIDPGVPALFVEGVQPLGLVLKSGNFGDLDFYVRALAVLEGR